jgi:3-methyl-2-oxobutanoate hydroxymethyltransferase
MEAAGATMLVLELVPGLLADAVTRTLRIPTIGIGAGPGCSGQVLVLHDMLGVYPGRKARFVKNFVTGDDGVPRDLATAIGAYVAAVKDGSFPSQEHAYR